MPEFRAGELSQWVSRLWSNGIPEGPIGGVTQDTRTLRPGDLYVAIRGARLDGHRFLAEAFDKGAFGALVQEDFPWNSHPVLRVADTVRGLQLLARGYRKTWMGIPVGITGSVGKTTVKEMCAEILSMKGETHRTSGNYNNHIGLPLTMLAMPHSARYGVFEIGMNQPGEISELAYLLQPKIAVITDIGNAHSERFPSIEAIAREKSKLAERVPPSGMAIIDRDSPWYAMIRSHISASVVSISFEGIADHVGRRVCPGVMSVHGYDYAMPLPGEHVMRNALRAIALGLEVGLQPEQIAEGLRRFRTAPMRWQELDVGGIHFVNDAYNANPLSMRAGLRTFSNLAGGGRKWAVLGGMHELGAVAEEEHAALGAFVDELGLDGVIAVGELSKMIVCRKMDVFFRCAGPDEAALILKENIRAGDRVLLKASRAEGLERVLVAFRGM